MIIGDGIMLGAGGESASIFVTGVAQTNTVTCTKNGKSYKGEWKSKSSINPNAPLIPNMTSNTAPSGVASTNKTKEGSPYNSFDGNESTYFYGGDFATLPWYVQYEFDDIVSFDSFFYKVSTPTGDDGAYTAGHSVQISLDGSSWETIWSGSSSNGMNNPESNTVHLSETKRCKFIRWNTTSMNYWSSPTQCLWEFQVYGNHEDVVEGYEFTVNAYGTYTITATDGTKTATQDVLVDAAEVFTVEVTL